MPVRVSEFKKSDLWPVSNYRWFAPGAVRSTAAQYGNGLDLGALRAEGGWWEILWSRTPTNENPANSGWIPFDPRKQEHLAAANAFNRYGAGWSYGPAHNMHNEVKMYFAEVYGRQPTVMEKMDREHDKVLWQALEKAYREKIGFKPGTSPPPAPPPLPPPVPVPPVVPPVQPPGLPPLSTPEQRATELLSLLPPILLRHSAKLLPLAIEAVKAARRAQDRIVARVVAEVRK